MTEASSREEEGVQVLEPGPVESQQPVGGELLPTNGLMALRDNVTGETF